jgi:hypothetical protein
MAFLIPTVVIVAKITNTLLILYGLKYDPFTKGVVSGKFSAQMPNDDGTFGPKPSSKSVTVFLIGATCNHPLGPLAPGFKETGDHMVGMQKELDAKAEEYGLMGSSFWLAGNRGTSNGNMSVMYFKDAEYVYKSASYLTLRLTEVSGAFFDTRTTHYTVKLGSGG